MATKKTDEVIETKVEKNEPTKSTRTVHLFLDSERYSDDVQVGVNGKIYTIQRGIDVEVPRAVAEVLDHQKGQDDRTARMINQYERKFFADSQKYR